MVSGRRGTSTLGCLVWLGLFGASLYYGVHVGRMYVRFYTLQDEMEVQARLAPGLTDDVIRRRVIDKVRELNLPEEAERVKIRRLTRPLRIEIETQYRDSVDAFLLQRGFPFKPKAEAPL